MVVTHIYIAICLLIGMALGVATLGVVAEAKTVTIMNVLITLAAIPVYVYDARITVLRLHDINKTGRLAIPLIAMSALTGVYIVFFGWNVLVALTMVIACVIQLILLLIPGTKGANQYGEQPRRGKWTGFVISIVEGIVIGIVICVYILPLSSSLDILNQSSTHPSAEANNFPVALDKFPALEYIEPVDRINVWLYYADTTKKEAYIKKLQDSGFQTTDNTDTDDAEVWFTSLAEVWFDDADNIIIFSRLVDTQFTSRAIFVGLFRVFYGLPAFTIEQFGDTMYCIDVDLIYTEPIETSVLKDYLKTLDAAGFVYNPDIEVYELVDIDNEKQYHFIINEFDDGYYYTWRVLDETE